MSVCLTWSLLIYLSIYLFRLFTYISIYPIIYVYLSIYLYIHPPPIAFSVTLPVKISLLNISELLTYLWIPHANYTNIFNGIFNNFAVCLSTVHFSPITMSSMLLNGFILMPKYSAIPYRVSDLYFKVYFNIFTVILHLNLWVLPQHIHEPIKSNDIKCKG